MIWQNVEGEMLTYDGSKEAVSMLADRDLYISHHPKGDHICEMCSLDICVDWGPIVVGDKVLLLDDKVCVIRGRT